MVFGCAAVASALLSAGPASAQVTAPLTAKPPRVRMIEWNLPVQGDARPGAVIVDTLGHDANRMWFVTRLTQPHLYRLDFPKSLMKGSARWTSWKLNAILTGGLRRVRGSYDRRYIFIRTITGPDPNNTSNPGGFTEALERVDTDPTKCPGTNCATTVYQSAVPSDFSFDVSDIAVDDQNNVWSTHTPNFDPSMSYVQRLTPGTSSAQVTRWNIPGSGAGLCGDPTLTQDQNTVNTPCISGIAVHPNNRNLVYFSEPTTNTIAELNVASNPATVRRWSLTDLQTQWCAQRPQNPCLPLTGPRQLQVDKRGKVWVVTGSGDLVSLDPCRNLMTRHELPDHDAANPFGLATDDDVIGYTASQVNKVGMLLPKGDPVCITPSQPVCVTPQPATVTATTLPSDCASNIVYPRAKTVAAQPTDNPDGRFIEAKVDTEVDSNGNPVVNSTDVSTNPVGITPVKAKAQGTYFVTIGDNSNEMTFNQVAFLRIPIRGKLKFARDDDDENDGDDTSDHAWHDWHGHADDNDDDDDGVDNGHDQHDKWERDSRDSETTMDDGVVAAGGSKDYSMVATSTSLALVALTTASDPLAQIGIDIYDPNGLFVARSLPTPGLASLEVLLPAPGTYTCRVRNYGATPIVQTPTLFVRELWPQ